MITNHDLAATLAAILPALDGAAHRWWILGSAAVALHGGDPGEIGDVDVLIDRRDAEAVFASLGLALAAGEGTALFRSALFASWNEPPIPVELFAGFELCEGGCWSEIVPATRVAVETGFGPAYVPDRAELAAILRRFGRPKDQRRIAALSRISPSPSRSGSA